MGIWTIKKDAVNYLKDNSWNNYIKSFLACLILALVGGFLGGGYFSLEPTRVGSDSLTSISRVALNFNGFLLGELRGYLGMGSGLLLPIRLYSVLNILFMAVSILVLPVLRVGLYRFYSKGYRGEIDLKYLFSTFNLEEHWNIVATNLRRTLHVFFWSLLLIVPGIVKSYEYSMVDYIMAVEPNIHSRDALILSRAMTRGYKLSLFYLELSFILVNIIGAFSLLGDYIFRPYIEGSRVRAYEILYRQYFGDDL